MSETQNTQDIAQGAQAGAEQGNDAPAQGAEKTFTQSQSHFFFVPCWKKTLGKVCNLVYNSVVIFLLRFMTRQKKSSCMTACLKMAGADMEVMI